MQKRTKIVATLGPASKSIDVIRKLIEAGVNVFRCNFSHGTHDSHKEFVSLVREAALKLKTHIALLGDLCGPKIRVGAFKNGQVNLAVGQTFTLSENQSIVGDETCVSTSYPYLVQDVKIGDTVLLDDGNISLKAIKRGTDFISFQVIDGGVLKNKKGLNLPGISLSVKAITDKDLSDLSFILKEKFDYVALSFVRKAAEIQELRTKIGEAPIRIIAKIEKPEAIDDLEAILGATDAVMIARGDLGVEVPIERVPSLQKHILTRCSRRGIPAITATQMLESMISNQWPTRAETTDVFNAIIDGTDAIMLSGETAVGEYPIEAVKVMGAISCEAEKLIASKTCDICIMPEVRHEIEDTIAHAAVEAAVNVKAKAIVAYTHSGNTARNISKYHPPTPIFALTPLEPTCRRLALNWGVNPILVSDLNNTDAMISLAESTLKENGIVSSGDIVLIVAGVPLGVKGNTNFIKLHKI
ncbi:pyruvate kinase [bacterium]|nr:pyruvate kinase [bacterium]